MALRWLSIAFSAAVKALVGFNRRELLRIRRPGEPDTACFVDDCTQFTEVAATAGHLGTFPAREMLGLLLAHAGRLAKYGA